MFFMFFIGAPADNSLRLLRSLLRQEPHFFESSSRALYADSLVHVSGGIRRSSGFQRGKRFPPSDGVMILWWSSSL